MKYHFKLLIVLLISSSTLLAQEKESKKERKQRERQETYTLLQKLAENEEFMFKATAAFPQKGGRVDLTSRDNFLVLGDKKVKADLPYFGRAFTAPGYGESGGVQVEGDYSNYSVTKNDKKRSVTIKFNCSSSSSENYNLTISMGSLSNVSVVVQSNRRQSMRYQGEITMDK